jgi:tetratricopeptide (TPR) repeat protein
MEPATHREPDWTASLAHQVDQVCLRFEACWKAGAGQRPRVEDYLDVTGDDLREALLHELLALDLAYRHRHGERPTCREYEQRFPQDQALVRTAFAEIAPPATEPTYGQPGRRPGGTVAETRAPRRDDPAAPRTALADDRGQAESEASALGGAARAEPSGDLSEAAPLPGYEILGELGRGAMGVVYRVRQVGLKRVVALKMILSGAGATPQELARFRSEAEAVARLQHPNIVQVYEVGEHHGRPFFSLEHVDGGTLATKLRAGLPAAAEAAALVEQLARAMDAVHRCGVVHRDLKPANVLLTAAGTPKISDFGLAKKLDEDTGQTHAGAIMGTPSYMAPEQAAGGAAQATPRADVYALGAILYECLTGRPPFKAATVAQTLRQVVEQEPVPPRQLNAAAPRDVETICLKCLHKAPAQRYSTAANLADDLRRWRNGQPIQARPTPGWERAWKWARRHPSQAALLVSLGVLLPTLALGYAVYEGQSAAVLKEKLNRQEKYAGRREEARRAKENGQLELAKEKYDQALATLDNETDADPDERRRLLEEREEVVHALQQRQARRDLQEHRQGFRKARDQMRVHEIDFTEHDRASNRAAVARLASAALAELGVTLAIPPTEAIQRLADFRPYADEPGQLDQMAAECGEVLLAWAEAEAPAEGDQEQVNEPGTRRALQLLNLAAALGQAHHLAMPRALLTRRTRYLALVGEPAPAPVAGTAGGLQQETPLDLFLEALAAFHRGDFGESALACDRVLQWVPEHFWAQYLQGVCYYRGGRWGEARVAFTACLSSQPQFLWARLLRATAESQVDGEAAAADFAEVLRQASDPEDRLLRAVALTNRGAMWVLKQQPDQALHDLQEAIELRPDLPEAYLNLAALHKQRQDYDAALAALDEALRRRPNQALLFRTRAELQLVHRKDLQAARRDFEQAIAHEKGSASLQLASDYVQLANLQYRAEEHAAALASCEAALQVRADYAPAHLQRAETLLAQQRYPDAGRALHQYLATGKRTAAVYKALGLIQAGQRKYPEAVEAYGQALSLEPDADTHTYRGWAYLKLDAPRPALADFEAALQQNPRQTDAWCGRGQARVRVGEVRGAVADAEAALEHGRQTAPRQIATLLLQAACIYARAVGQRETPGNRGAAYRHQERALELLREALEHVPAAQRADFWREHIEREPDLRSLRQATGMLELARSYGR